MYLAIKSSTLNILHEKWPFRRQIKKYDFKKYDYPTPELFDMQLKCHCGTY